MHTPHLLGSGLGLGLCRGSHRLLEFVLATFYTHNHGRFDRVAGWTDRDVAGHALEIFGLGDSVANRLRIGRACLLYRLEQYSRCVVSEGREGIRNFVELRSVVVHELLDGRIRVFYRVMVGEVAAVNSLFAYLYQSGRVPSVSTQQR